MTNTQKRILCILVGASAVLFLVPALSPPPHGIHDVKFVLEDVALVVAVTLFAYWVTRLKNLPQKGTKIVMATVLVFDALYFAQVWAGFPWYVDSIVAVVCGINFHWQVWQARHAEGKRYGIWDMLNPVA